jgi:hypothetical protein
VAVVARLLGMHSDPHEPVEYIEDRPFGRLRDSNPRHVTIPFIHPADWGLNTTIGVDLAAKTRNQRKKTRQKRAGK